MSFHQILTDHLAGRSWREIQCPTCGERIWRRDIDGACQKCLALTGSVARVPVFWEEVWSRLRKTFVSAGFAQLSTISIATDRRRGTLFLGSGLQILEPVIFDESPQFKGPLFIHQPVVRLNYLSRTQHAGYGTSFVNLCTEQTRATAADYLVHLDLWLIAIRSTLGMKVEVALENCQWRGGPFEGTQLNVFAAGVLVGDAIFIESASGGASTLLPIVDFSFGLERLVGAANGSRDFWPYVGPLPDSALAAHRTGLDAIKTATLLVLAGVSPSARRHGRELRRLYRRIAVQPPIRDTLEVARYFADYWRDFLPANSPASGYPLAEVNVVEGMQRAKAERLRLVVGCDGQAASGSTTDICRALLRRGMTLGDVAGLATLADNPLGAETL
jgi:hypothetical protein